MEQTEFGATAAVTSAADDVKLLTTRQMAEFVRDGFLEFPSVIDADTNASALAEMARRHRDRASSPPPDTLTPLSQCYPDPSPFGLVLRNPTIAGAIRSLLGPEPAFDHDWTHRIEPHWPHQQQLHVDAKQDSDVPSFDIQLFYFPHDVGQAEGGTRFVPGTHLRRVEPGEVGRYQHILGERRFSGPAGTVVAMHHGMWHAGQRNPVERPRWMHKYRFNPTTPQVRHWDLSDFTDIHNDPVDHMFATMRDDTAATMFRFRHKWMTISASRIETVQRARLWRYLTGDETYDVDYYLGRIERRDPLARTP